MRYLLVCETKQGVKVLERAFNSTLSRATHVAECIASLELPYNFKGIRGEVRCALMLSDRVIHRFIVG